MKLTRYVLGVGLGLIALAMPKMAKADDFTFSFTDTGSGVAGTVTGEILGLTNNTTGPAVEVILTSFPSGLNSALGPGPINVTAWPQQFFNSFTETNGQITAAIFEAGMNTTCSDLNLNNSGTSLLVLEGPVSGLCQAAADHVEVFNNGGLAALNISPMAASAPEPSSMLLLGIGSLALMVMTWRMKRLT